jgi:hypothetical protein
MAKQNGIIKLRGSLGGINFFKSGEDHLAREASSVSASRIANDPAYQRTRENNMEFGRAGKAGKLIRDAFRPLLQQVKGRYLTSQLLSAILRVIRTDEVNARGQRRLIDGQMELLEGFNFGDAAKLTSSLFIPYTASIDRPGGKFTVTLPSFVSAQSIASPPSATHAKLVVGAANIDFEAGAVMATGEDSAIVPLNNVAIPDVTLTAVTQPAPSGQLFLVLGVQFGQMVNQVLYPLNNGAFNALAIVKVQPN